MIPFFLILYYTYLSDLPQVVEEGCRVGQSRDYPGLGRRLFQRDRAGDGGAQAVIVQVELDCLALAPVGTVEMPAGQGNGESGALQGALQVITCLFCIRRCPYCPSKSNPGTGRLW